MKKAVAKTDLLVLRDRIRAVAKERNWERLDTPRNLATALCVEAAELLEPFQWLMTGDLSELQEDKLIHIREEMADVLIYLIALADKLETDLFAATIQKLDVIREKYPVEKATSHFNRS